MRLFRFLIPAILLCAVPAVASAQGDDRDYYDPLRPVMRLGRDHATVQWFTRTPCVDRVQIRASGLPCNTYGRSEKPWQGTGVRVVAGPPGLRTYHRVEVTGLQPGTRYYYRFYDPGVEPTGLEKTWGAEKPWRREWAFSTLAPKGRKTIIRVPIKVLLMPNVINVASAHDASGQAIPPPPKLTPQELDRVKAEYADSARFLFINNGMRVWYDYHLFIDDRWQRWGPEPANVASEYKAWPVCRSYAGVDFADPGGGDFTIVDTSDAQRTNHDPVVEKEPYVGQIEQAFPRRWDHSKKVWVFYNSGGGTLGADDWAKGIPGRSQYLGGGDTAWLATHEFHHQIEALGGLSFGNSENDRVIFDHFFPRRRVKKADGTYDEWTWSTSWAHGEHWDGISYFDRLLTPAQWLRFLFGETITVADADGDGVPDDDPRLPFDEKRFGSDPRRASTDGAVGDLAKIQESTWAPAPLTTSWDKAPYPYFRPKARSTDSDRDGVPDSADPYPTYPWQPYIWPMKATVDGKPDEWNDIPLAGRNEAHGVTISFQEGHDDAAYYACFRLKGPWAHVAVGLDGEGEGYYTTDSTYAFDIVAGGDGGATVHPTSGNKCPGMVWKAGRDSAGETTVEISIPNRGEGLWFWTGGGRPVGAAISLWTKDGKPLSIYDPYHFFYARMVERSGKVDLPTGAPKEMAEGPDVTSFDFTKQAPGPEWKHDLKAWSWQNGAMRFTEGLEDNALYLAVSDLSSKSDTSDFDVWVEFEAKSDMHIGAWSPQAKALDNMTDYVAFLGGFGNARSVIRVAGTELGSEDSGIAVGKHTMQLSRHAGQLWLLYDGKPLAYARDPTPDRRINRIGFLGGWGGEQVVYRARIRTER